LIAIAIIPWNNATQDMAEVENLFRALP